MWQSWDAFWLLVFYRWMYRRGKHPYIEGRIGRYLRLAFRHSLTKILASITSGMVAGHGIISHEPAYLVAGFGLFALFIAGFWKGYIHVMYPDCCQYAAAIDEMAIHRGMSPAQVIDECVQADATRTDSVRSEPER